MTSRTSVVAVAALGIVCCGLSAPCPAAQTPDGRTYVWWEAEAFDETNLDRLKAPFPGNIRPDERAKLSDGTWIAPRSKGVEEPHIAWTVEVPEPKTYNFWVRKFWKHGPFRWRFDDGETREVGKDIVLHDNASLRLHIGANWVYLGEVKLSAGKHTLHVEPTGGAFDCFLLIDGPFIPRGKLKPGEKAGAADEGFFAWEPPSDPLADDCPIDLRHLNEPQAGASGFVRRMGKDLVLGNGRPVRFWMVQAGLRNLRKPMMDYWARRMAKYGINLARMGMLGLFRLHRDGKDEAFARELDKLHYTVAALKREGIYVYLGHLYWHTSVKVSEAHGFEGYGKGRSALGLMFFDPKMQKLYKSFADRLLNTPNPYTKLPMSKDPAVAVVEIQNESNLLFWAFNPERMVPRTRELIERAFANFAAKKYGSIDKALAAWGPKKKPGRDHPEDGRLALYGPGHLTGQSWAAAQRNVKRAGDQLQFYYEWQKGFYAKMASDFRKQLGVRNLISCSNWKTADAAVLGVLERASYTAGDVICRNVYYGVDYKPKPKRFYAIDVGDTFKGYSSLKPPGFPGPFTIGHVYDHPYMLTETNWTRPNPYRAEWPFLVATYGSMAGVDGWVFFAQDSALWASQMGVWDINNPTILGQFPAAALTFRAGYVKEAPAAVTDHLAMEDLYAFKGASLYEMGGKDALWEARIGDLEGAPSERKARVDPLAFFVGKVNRVPGEGPSRVEKVDLGNYIERKARTVRSLTSQLRWDFGTGVATVAAPKVAGAAGFLAGAGRIELGPVAIEAGNDYASIMVVSLDGKPLGESARILIQAATKDRPSGFETQPRGEYRRITDLGGYPLIVRRIDAKVTIPAGRARATVLDGNGYRTDRQAETAAAGGGRLTVELPAESLYTLVEIDR